jgi:hypothetical protein
MLILKHLNHWSYEELEHEVRANLVYRSFARVGCEGVPDAKTLVKIAQVLGDDAIQALHRRVVKLAVEAGVVRGRRMRVDTTVVETNIHYPTDSSLLADGIRVLTRTIRRVHALVGEGSARLRNRMRSVGRRCLEIKALSRTPSTRAGLPKAYRCLVATTRSVLRDAKRCLRRAAQKRSKLATGRAQAALARLEPSLSRTVELVERVIDQTKKRVLGGDIHVPHKVLSIFEPHTEAIRKGKVVKPTEFGKLVTIQEAEHQIISAYSVHATRPADSTLWAPSLTPIKRSSVEFPSWPRRTGVSTPRAMNDSRSSGESNASSCREQARSRKNVGHTRELDGFAGDRGGVLAVRARSVSSNAATGSTVVGITDRRESPDGSGWVCLPATFSPSQPELDGDREYPAHGPSEQGTRDRYRSAGRSRALFDAFCTGK